MRNAKLVFNIRLKDSNSKEAFETLEKAGLKPFWKIPEKKKIPYLMVEVKAKSKELKKAKEFLMDREFNISIK